MANEARFINLNSIIEEELSGKWVVEYASKSRSDSDPNKRHFFYKLALNEGYENIMDASRKVFSVIIGEGFRVEAIWLNDVNSITPSMAIDITDIRGVENGGTETN